MQIMTFLQIAISLAIIALILIQVRSSVGAALFGGGGDGGFYHARRGLEKILFLSTVVLIFVFMVIAILDLIF